MTDRIVVAVLLVSFALAATMHLAFVMKFASRPPRGRALAALVMPPLGFYWAWRLRMRGRALVGAVALMVYFVALAVAWR